MFESSYFSLRRQLLNGDFQLNCVASRQWLCNSGGSGVVLTRTLSSERDEVRNFLVSVQRGVLECDSVA